MTRREFLGAAIAATAAQRGWAAQTPAGVKITRVVNFDLHLRRPKYIGKNSHRDDHGETSSDRVLRLYTNAGVDGFGTCSCGANECAQLLGRDPFDFFRPDERRVASPLARYTSPLWDLCGRLLKKPVYELLGGKAPAGGPARVPVYDGTIYFSELVPQYAPRGLDRFKDEIDLGLKMGHRAFKVKIGRGYHWMRAEEGYARDIDVLKVIRRHAGPGILIAVDTNDGYDLARSKRLLTDLPDYGFAWLEEMFIDNVEHYLELKRFLAERGCKALVSDGENTRRPGDMKRWVEAKAVDILQGDMNQFGFEDIVAEAEMARPAGIQVAPHNWGSLIAYYLQLQVGPAVPNFYRAEHDPLTCPALIADGYTLANGESTVPDAPGLGLMLDDARLPDFARVHFDLKL